MNTKSGIFTRGFATRENTAFVVHSVKIKIDLTLKKSNILYIFTVSGHEYFITVQIPIDFSAFFSVQEN